MKLQKLLNKHKDELWDWKYQYPNLVPWNDWVYYIELNEYVLITLTHLLFSTHFLEIIKLKRNTPAYREKRSEWLFQNAYHEINNEFYKIELAILRTDKERVEYIEAFTL